MSLFTKLFGTYSDRQIKRLEPTVRAVEALAEHYGAMSEEELRGTTERLRARLAAGETLDDILPDAFAAVREADWRVLGKRPFRVQVMGGILLHQGRIAEMKTGEGKTLVATMPAYLNALAGNGVHIVTVNDYLARRDSEEMGRVYGYLGLRTGLVVAHQHFADKKAAYEADITYGTNDEFGFDYLRDNMQVYKQQQVQRGHAYAIVDEVDSILVDEARTPLIISGEGEEATEMYLRADRFVRTLKKAVLSDVDEAKQEADDDEDDELDETYGEEDLDDLEDAEELDEADDADDVDDADEFEEYYEKNKKSSKEKKEKKDKKKKKVASPEKDKKTEKSEEELAKEKELAEADYIVSEKGHHAVLTARGIKKAEHYFRLKKYSSAKNAELVHHINQALHAHGCMMRDVDYIVKQDNAQQGGDPKQGSVIIVDSFTGRLMPGRRYSNGLHQAIEAKEGVAIQKENRTQATITYQNYFRLYRKLSGMTGTALTEENEFREIYGLDVVEVPTNRPMIRIDHTDLMYLSLDAKQDAIVQQIKACHAKGQPILVGTVDIEKSEKLSARLTKEGIPHHVLNAKQHEAEAEIVAQAGKLGAVTIATNMAGRGTDIMLGGNPEHMAKVQMREEGFEDALIAQATGSAESDDTEVNAARARFRELYEDFKVQIAPEAQRVREAGGLFILGTERHESRRIDNQLRGRSGRQGDPGESRFCLSLEDDLMRLFGSERVIKMVSHMGLPADGVIDARILSGSVETAQRNLEDQNFKRRKNVLAYDDVMNQQRTVIYKQRGEVLDNCDLSQTIQRMLTRTVEETVARYTLGDMPDEWDIVGLRESYMGVLVDDEDEHMSEGALRELSREALTSLFLERAMARYRERETAFGEVGGDFREAERSKLLRAVDSAWMEHIDAMEDLKGGIGLQSYAHRDPVTEFRVQSCEIFDSMIADIRANTVRMLLVADPQDDFARKQVARPLTAGHGGANSAGVRVVLNTPKEQVAQRLQQLGVQVTPKGLVLPPDLPPEKLKRELEAMGVKLAPSNGARPAPAPQQPQLSRERRRANERAQRRQASSGTHQHHGGSSKRSTSGKRK